MRGQLQVTTDATGHRHVDWRGKSRLMSCCECDVEIFASIVEAHRHGWITWVGGALCPRHEVVCVIHRPRSRPARARRQGGK